MYFNNQLSIINPKIITTHAPLAASLYLLRTVQSVTFDVELDSRDRITIGAGLALPHVTLAHDPSSTQLARFPLVPSITTHYVALHAGAHRSVGRGAPPGSRHREAWGSRARWLRLSHVLRTALAIAWHWPPIAIVCPIRGYRVMTVTWGSAAGCRSALAIRASRRTIYAAAWSRRCASGTRCGARALARPRVVH